MVRLVISDHEGSTTVVPLLRDEVTIGRKEGNTIRLTERNISRRHLRLERIGGVYKLHDADSYNGVLVNGRKVEGSTPLNNGDQIQLGDYTILVEEDLNARTAPPQAQESSHPHSQPHMSAAPSRRPVVPARLVMLTQPASGAEFVLPTEHSARLGRSDDVDCPINHRSVSREHAVIRPNGEHFLIEDLASANGVTVNGRQVKSVELRSGDIIELGQVVFRFVAMGEHYFFDPGEATRYRNVGSSGRTTANTRFAMLLGVVTLVALVFVLLPAPDVQQPSDLDPPYAVSAQNDGTTRDDPYAEPRERDDPRNPGQAPAPAVVDDGYDNAVLACRSALAATRFAEAAAHASLALKIRPTAAEALDCKQRADAQSLEEQIYVRGKDALQRGEAELAYSEFARLPENSSFRSRSEVALAASSLARARLDEARAALPGNRAEAARLAQSVLGLRGVTSEQLAAAEQLIADARESRKESSRPQAATAPSRPAQAPSAPARPLKPPTQPAETPARSTKSSNASASNAAKVNTSAPSSALLGPTQGTDTRTHTATSNAAAASSGGAKPIDIANACLARGDNECVVHALEGNANSAQELALLIETYRTIGDVRQAKKYMTTYVQRYPSDRSSDQYRRLLELQK